MTVHYLSAAAIGLTFLIRLMNKNSSGDEIANINFFYDDIVHVEASAYAH